MSGRINLVPIEADVLFSAIQAQIDARKGAISGQAGAVQFFDPLHRVGFAPETLSEENFCEQDYLLSNPDIADAVKRGKFRSGFEHWVGYGKDEGRSFQPAEFIEREYLELNPDVAKSVEEGQFASGLDHWRRRGRLEGRRIKKAMPRLMAHLKRLRSEMQIRFVQIGEVPPGPSTLRGVVGRQIIHILCRVLWWYTQSLLALGDVAMRAFEEQIAVLEYLGAAQGENQRRLASIQEAVNGIATRAKQATQQHQQFEARIGQLESRLRSVTELNATLGAQVRGLLGDDPDHKLDALYLAFEDVFRGPREEIKRRQSVYLEFLKEAQAPILDLGSGRGEWLELLRENEITAKGLDFNTAMVAQCRALGLDVQQGEALAYLRSLPDNSLGVISCFHVIEHIPFASVVSLLQEAIRVLRPGGLLILETPNPKNLMVASEGFYLDPTHLKPLPPEMLRFFVEATGFSNCQVLELQPGPFPPADESLAVSSRLHQLLYGPRDYGLIGRRP